jgi:hypothetical protein
MVCEDGGSAAHARQVEALCQLRRDLADAKAAVGWALRGVWKHDRAFVGDSAKAHLMDFSMESLANALKRDPKAPRAAYVVRLDLADGRSRLSRRWSLRWGMNPR